MIAGRPGADDHDRDDAGIVGHAYLDRGCAGCRDRSRRRRWRRCASTTSPCVQVLGVAWPGRLKNTFHLTAGGSRLPMISTGFGGALSAVPTGVPVSTRSPADEPLEPRERLQRLQRPVDHVAVDEHVLAQLRR